MCVSMIICLSSGDAAPVYAMMDIIIMVTSSRNKADQCNVSNMARRPIRRGNVAARAMLVRVVNQER